MSYLAVNKFDNETSEIETNIRINSSCIIKAVRFKILKHGILEDGALTLQILKDDNVLATKVIDYTEINQINGTYAYGHLSFELREQVAINVSDNSNYVELKLKLSMSDHTENNSKYLALIKEENPFNEEYGTRPPSISEDIDLWFNPYSIEIYSISRS